MNKKIVITTLIFAVVAFALTPFLWPFSSDASHMPPANLIPFFQGVLILSSIAFGIGVSFLIFGYPLMRKVEKGFGLAFWAFLSVFWLLVSWWPHENLHRVYEGNYFVLILLEYGFHVTLYVAGVILAVYLFRQFRKAAKFA